MVEVFKDISAVVGCISGIIALSAIVCRPLRKWIVSFVQRSSNKGEVERQLCEIKEILAEQNRTEREFRMKMEETMEITLDFTEKQCRNIIKNIFERYKDTKVLPLSERKTLIDMEDLYIRKLRKNHWGKTLLDQMATWDVDLRSADIYAFDDED